LSIFDRSRFGVLAVLEPQLPRALRLSLRGIAWHHLVPGTWHLASGIWHLAPGTWHLASPGTWHLASGIWHLAPGTWHLAPGIWHHNIARRIYNLCKIPIIATSLLQVIVIEKLKIPEKNRENPRAHRRVTKGQS